MLDALQALDAPAKPGQANISDIKALQLAMEEGQRLLHTFQGQVQLQMTIQFVPSRTNPSAQPSTKILAFETEAKAFSSENQAALIEVLVQTLVAVTPSVTVVEDVQHPQEQANSNVTLRAVAPNPDSAQPNTLPVKEVQTVHAISPISP